MLSLAVSSSSSTVVPTKPLVFRNPNKSSFNGIRIPPPPCLRVQSTSSSSSSSSSLVVVMTKRAEEIKEIRAKTTEEINEEIIDLKGELFMLRLQKSAREDFKNSEFGRMRKRVARMLTIKRERELEQGIKKRLSRKLDRQWKKSIVVRPPPSLRKMQEEEKAAAAAEAEKSA